MRAVYEVLGRELPLKVAARDQTREQPAIPGSGMCDEVAGGKDLADAVTDGLRRARERGTRIVVGVQLRERMLDEGRQLRAGSGPRGQFQMLPPRSWNDAESSRRLNPLKCDEAA